MPKKSKSKSNPKQVPLIGKIILKNLRKIFGI